MIVKQIILPIGHEEKERIVSVGHDDGHDSGGPGAAGDGNGWREDPGDVLHTVDSTGGEIAFRSGYAEAESGCYGQAREGGRGKTGQHPQEQ